jgi:hypothetical protein
MGWKAVAGAAVAVVVGGVAALSVATRSPGPSRAAALAQRPAVHEVRGASTTVGTPAPWADSHAAAPGALEASSPARSIDIDLEADRPARRATTSVRAARRASARHGAGSPNTSVSVDTLAAERTVLDRARAALLRHDGAAALDALRSHQQSFPRGQLLEERESMRVQAFAQVHDAATVSAAEKFKRQFPRSMFLPAVEQAVASLP